MSEVPDDPAYAERLATEARRWAPDAKAASNHGNWLSLGPIRAHVNRQVTGDTGVGWEEGVARAFLFGTLDGRGRGLTLGCSDGGAERAALAVGLCAEFDAFDISDFAVAAARERAAAEGLDIRYAVADVNRLELEPQRYDLALGVMALHHFERLEHVFDQVARALRPGGFLLFNEFVGPSRFRWTDEQLAGAREALALVPEHLRLDAWGRPVENVERPDPTTFDRDDPFEAIRSKEILPLVRERFEVLAERPYGGAVLHLALAGIAQNFDETRAEDRAILERLIAFEAEQMRTGRVGSDFTVCIARRRNPSTGA